MKQFPEYFNQTYRALWGLHWPDIVESASGMANAQELDIRRQ